MSKHCIFFILIFLPQKPKTSEIKALKKKKLKKNKNINIIIDNFTSYEINLFKI